MKRFILIIVILVSVSNIFSQELTKLSFALHWTPQSQFAGYYLAKDLGIYKKHGIDLTIIPAGPGVSTSAMLQKGEVDFALLWLSNAIQLKANKTDIVNISQIVNRSALMLIAKKSSGIKSPEDMNGKKIGIWGGDFQIQPMAFFKKYNLNVKTIMQGNSINLFFFGGVDVTSAMWYNEYHTILNSGFNPEELNTFFYSDYGLNFPEEGIYCSEKFYSEHPDLCKAFVEATLEGWQYAFSHPDEAVNIILKYMKEANIAANKSHQRWMLESIKDLIFPHKKTDSFERLTMHGYLLVARTLKEEGLIKEIPDFYSLYKPVINR